MELHIRRLHWHVCDDWNAAQHSSELDTREVGLINEEEKERC